MAANSDPLELKTAGRSADQKKTDPLEKRTILLHRTIATVSPTRIEIRPPRSTLILPIVGIVSTIVLLAILVLWTDSLPFWLLPVILLVSVIILPLSGVTLVYAVFGANIIADKVGQNVSVKQRYLGLGVGTTDLVPFWKIQEFLIEDVGRADAGTEGMEVPHAIAQWDLVLVKTSGSRIRLAGYSLPRGNEEEGLSIVMGVALAFSALTHAPIRGPIQ